MPENLTIAVFVLGAIMLLLALVSGGFKVFGSDIPGVAGRGARIIAFAIGVGLVGFSLLHFQDASAPKAVDHPPPLPAPASSNTQDSNDAKVHLPTKDSPAPTSTTPQETLNDPAAARVFGREGVDFGVPPRNTVEDNVGSPTPLTIPGAQTITTGELVNALRAGRHFLLIDVLDYPHSGLPNARRYPGVGMANPTTDLTAFLEKDTNGDKAYPVVFYCQGPQCWESYNAALRARDAGYTNVYWYRGGLEAWAMANASAT